MQNPLIKYNKLKRFASHISDNIRDQVDQGGQRVLDLELDRVDCLNRGDIYTRRDLWERLDAIASCASLVELRKYDTGEIRVHNANYCHNSIVCPVCADRVSKRRKAIFSEPIKRAVRRFGVDRTTGDWKPNYPEAYTGVYMATATISDGDNLKDRIDTLLDSIKRMRKMGQKRKRGRSLGEWSKVRAGLSNIELKIGRGSKKWHAHAHFLIFTDSPIDTRVSSDQSGMEYFAPNKFGKMVRVSKTTKEWYTATKGEGIDFDFRPVSFRKNVHGKKCETFEESVQAQAQEVFKYNSLLTERKGTNTLSAIQYIELLQRRGTRRLFNTIGLLRCDKRNEDSLITITERELRRLEYVDEMDCKTYDIYASLWQNGGTYAEPLKQNAALFSSSDDKNTRYINIRRRAFLAQTAKYQGAYRKERNALFKNRWQFIHKETFEDLLNTCRDMFRNCVTALWNKYGDMDFIPEFLCAFDSDGIAGYRQKHLIFAG